MEPENTQDIWQVDSCGTVFDGTLDDLKTWIADGAVVRIDRVRRGDLRWIANNEAVTKKMDRKGAGPDRVLQSKGRLCHSPGFYDDPRTDDDQR